MGSTTKRVALVLTIVAGVTGMATLSAVAGSPSRCQAGRDYELVTTTATWEDARVAAIEAGGHLVNISSEKEQACVREIEDGNDVWIGASDQAEEGMWRWTGVKKGLFWRGDGSGTAYGYENWNGGEPNNSGNEDCAVMFDDGLSSLWNDSDCGNMYAYIIEY